MIRFLLELLGSLVFLTGALGLMWLVGYILRPPPSALERREEEEMQNE